MVFAKVEKLLVLLAQELVWRGEIGTNSLLVMLSFFKKNPTPYDEVGPFRKPNWAFNCP